MKKLIIITGPTASGKTALAIKLAKRFNGEIISADSRAIYKGIDIASAKPSLEEREGVPHWGFDLTEPDQIFTAADFKEYAFEKISEIHSRGKIPFLVGGTGLYIDAVLYDYDFAGEPDEELRAELNSKSIEELQAVIEQAKIEMPENSKNKRYLIRAIEKSKKHKRNSGKKHNGFNSIVVGITTERDELRTRIFARNEQFFSSGIIEEAQKMAQKYGWQSEAMTTNAYPLIRDFLDENLTKEELIEKMSVRDWRLAKRQITFMKRNKDINWLTLAEAEQYISSKMNK
jgi:tRNA dimethylallyltransferase